MSVLASLNVRIGADIKEFQKGLNQINRDTRNLTRGMRQVGRELTQTFTLPVAAISGFSLKISGDFEQSMNRVRALTQASDEEFKLLRDTARELGRSTVFSARESADALGFLAQAGFSARQAADALPGVLDLAAAGMIEIAEAADIASNIMSGFNLQISDLGRLNDVLANTFVSSNTNLQQLGEAFQYVGPVAASVNLSLEETAAALGLLGNAGIQASMAGTTLRGIISRLINPTKEVSDILDRLGVNATDTEGNFRSLADIIDDLSISGASAADIMAIFGDRAGPGMSALLSQGGEALRKFTQDNLESAGTAADIADTQLQGFAAAMEELQGAAEDLAIAIGDAGLLENVTNLVSGLAEVVQGLTETSPEMINFATNAALITAALGPLLWGTAQLITALGTIRKTILLLRNPLTTLIGSVGLLTAGFAAMATGAVRAIRGINNEIASGAGQLETLAKYSGPGAAAYRFQASQGRDRSADVTVYSDAAKGIKDLSDAFGIFSTEANKADESLGPLASKVNDLPRATKAAETDMKAYQSEVLGVADALQKLADAAILASRQVDLQRLSTPLLGNITTARERLAARGGLSDLSVDPAGGLNQLTAAQQNLQKIAEKVNATLTEQGLVFEKITYRASESFDALDILEEGFQRLAASAASIADAGGTFREVAQSIKESAQSIIGSMIRQGITSVVSGALTSNSFLGPFAIPIAAAAGALAQGAFNSIISSIQVPAFADGGLIYGPTLGLMGEYPGARTNPEVVGKLSDIKSLISFPEMMINVVGRISGRDIELVQERNTNFKKRLK